MIELGVTFIFHPRDWGFGFGYPQVDGGPGIPCIGIDIQVVCFKLQITLYKNWEWKPEDDE